MKYFLVAFAYLIISCNSGSNKTSEENTQANNFFQTGNWRVINDTDTSFMFFSKQVDSSFKIYEYRMINGDSVETQAHSITREGDNLKWTLFNKIVYLRNANDTLTEWSTEPGENTSYILAKINDSVMHLQGDNKSIYFNRTLPISTFLVRAKYDFLHSTRWVDSLEIKRRK